MSIQVLTPSLVDHLEEAPDEERGLYLFLEPHEEFRGAWYVSCLDQSFFFDFEDIIGQYSALFPFQYSEFETRATELGYQVVFIEDNFDEMMEEHRRLNDPPPFAIESSLEGTVNGFLPWQIEGFNKLIKPDDLKGGLCLWDTGTGKTAFVAMGIMWHLLERKEADLVFVVVKSNNKRDMMKKLKRLANIDSVILDGTVAKRAELFLDIDEGKSPPVVITNYEKFREDQEFFQELLTNRRILIFWDEMPTKLKNRGTQLYRAVRDSLYKPHRTLTWGHRRPKWLRQYELTATPIETNPGNLFSCVRLIDPEALGNVKQFESEHVQIWDKLSRKPKVWRAVDKIGFKLEFMKHRVDKTDPAVAKYFPKIYEDTVYIDWHPSHRKIYDGLTLRSEKLLGEEDISLFSLLMVMRMMCDAPSMVIKSAENRKAFEELLQKAIEDEDPSIISGLQMGSEAALRLVQSVTTTLTDDHHTKLQRLQEDLTERYPGSKVILFSTFAGYLQPILEERLAEWGVTYITYAGTQKQRDDAKDYWRATPECRVLVCSDAGSDSVDLPEANLVINYDLPTLFSRKYQRIHRASRADSQHEQLIVLNYVMADSVEERFLELIEERYGYHANIVGDEVQPLTPSDLRYALLGHGS